ncbi:MAG: ribulose bisphosphate carboxylase small subunit [Acidimicrobiales bacterium]
MRVTQGTFSFLPDFTDDEIKLQLEYAIQNKWALAVEFTDDPHPRNSYWEMWDLPMFDIGDAAGAFIEIKKCREAYPNHYVKVSAYDPSPNRATTAFDLIVNRPPEEPGFQLERTEVHDRKMNYTIRSYATNVPHGERYQTNGK